MLSDLFCFTSQASAHGLRIFPLFSWVIINLTVVSQSPLKFPLYLQFPNRVSKLTICLSLCLLACALSPTLFDPMDCRPPGSSVHGIFQAGILKWVAISYFRGSSWPRDQTQVSCEFITESPGSWSPLVFTVFVILLLSSRIYACFLCIICIFLLIFSFSLYSIFPISVSVSYL